MGTPAFAVPSLRIIKDNGYPLVAVVTAPDKPRGRGQQVSFTPVKEEALRLSLPVLQPVSLKDPAFAGSVRELAPDLMVVVAFRILPPEVFTIPPLGAFNLHASLLPKYRGAAPINWAVINGETETGVTTFLLQEKVDTGSILLRARIAIGPSDTAGDVHDTLSIVGAEIVLHTVRGLAGGSLHPQPQDDHQATSAPKFFKNDCRIDWTRPAQDICDRVRGLAPVPTAWTLVGGNVWKIFRVRVADASATGKESPGTIVHLDRTSCIVRTGRGTLAVEDVMLEGRKRLGIEEFLRGHPLKVGMVLGN
jgi:methionyl-tRNA formyltransferase